MGQGEAHYLLAAPKLVVKVENTCRPVPRPSKAETADASIRELSIFGSGPGLAKDRSYVDRLLVVDVKLCYRELGKTVSLLIVWQRRRRHLSKCHLEATGEVIFLRTGRNVLLCVKVDHQPRKRHDIIGGDVWRHRPEQSHQVRTALYDEISCIWLE